MTSKIAVIGFGNIAKAIITPLFEKKLLNPKDVYCLVNIIKSYKYDINVFQANTKGSEIIRDCKVKLLSVKPQQLKNIIELGGGNNNLLVSILAGVSLEKLIKRFPNHKCVRVVTNIPIIIGKGSTGISWGDEITEDQKQFTRRLFENTSKIYEFPEDLLDIFLSVTSSGPAIIALIIEALSDGGLSGGLPKKLSEELVMEMMLGTVSLIKETNLTTAEIKNMVTSPGGTTISALRVLEDRSLRSALIEAVVSASNRSKEFR
ncbi:pyrroline-5-carboxylate reductase [Prochlorococcus sp. AH-716-D22]|nr:pyrroline-5-carboxylate reductase [Prochlorococcus sp. AH-716-D22]